MLKILLVLFRVSVIVLVLMVTQYVNGGLEVLALGNTLLIGHTTRLLNFATRDNLRWSF